MRCMKLHVWSLGIALGFVWGISMLFTGLVAMLSGWGVGFIENMRTIYLGYEADLLGSLIGGVWGFIDAFIAGVIIAAIYNLCVRYCCSEKDKN